MGGEGSYHPWRKFPRSNFPCVQTAQRLIRDLQINLAGASLALDLLEELEELRRQVLGKRCFS